ncbi:MAG: hypothetical protein CUN49_06235 [Candidatus Thermofonsia Clade 1 bacterium]|jgi:hypothetical protein|uniref:STAS/SEC14 domain-containing protein n=1 Tax=Candidatus Thermofonsia Clade 1 bacterium TaxID=2364210 RepID=A0A2M8PFH3_9CHLR|nr:MAG: hypothetical protein CUN49_06235 [Candidatus Thermofonsia Clade 1 bacterium]RMF49466.1 MAG: hypothetical protein D6749_13170 [Chloroflexota bacterium]
MPVRVTWYEPDQIILYKLSDPLTLSDLEAGAVEVWALAAGVSGIVDMIFDYRAVTEFPRGMLPLMRDGSFTLPTLERVALVGNEPLVEMMFATITQSTYRPDPTVHTSVEEAADFLRRMAREDSTRE